MRFFLRCIPLVLLVAARLHAAPEVLAVDLGGAVKLDLVVIKKGAFTQGSPASEAGRGNDETQRPVTLTRDFYIGKTAVTRAQWERFVAETNHRSEAESGPSGGFGWDGSALTQRKEFTWKNPGFTQAGDHPVCLVTFADAGAFCRWLEKKSGRTVTLPTEAEWEFAARAGGAANVSESAWSKQNSGSATHPVTSTKPNAWGLHIGGNVAEWCADWYAPYDAGAVTNPLQTNSSLSDKPRRVLRGGSWNRDAKNTRSAARFRADEHSRNADIGFRVVCSVDAAPTPPATATNAPRPTVTAAPQPVTPVSHQPVYVAPPSKASSSGGFMHTLWVWFVPLLLLVFVLKKLFRRFSGGGFSSASSGGPPPMPQAPRTGGGVKIADDGFWLSLDDVAAGSRVHYKFQPQGGMETNDNVIYSPSPQGQFIYTGVKPVSARVTGVDAPGNNPLSGSSTMRSSGPGARGVGFGTGYVMGSTHHHDQHSSSSHQFTDNDPPRNPAAY